MKNHSNKCHKRVVSGVSHSVKKINPNVRDVRGKVNETRLHVDSFFADKFLRLRKPV